MKHWTINYPDENGNDVVETLYDRVLGRTSVHDVIHPSTGKLIINAGKC